MFQCEMMLLPQIQPQANALLEMVSLLFGKAQTLHLPKSSLARQWNKILNKNSKTKDGIIGNES